MPDGLLGTQTPELLCLTRPDLHHQVAVEYDRDPRTTGRTKFPLRRMIKFAVDGISSFGQDADGELYITSVAEGAVYRIDPE